jgi:DNA-binding GntR family transcriptional regulator
MSHKFEKLIKDPLHGVIVTEIEDAILRGKLKPGSRLIESVVSDQFGVSRGPVREAMVELEMSGLIERIPYRGAVVTSELTEEDVSDLKNFRKILEVWAASWILEQDSSKQDQILQNLETIVEEMEVANQDADLSRMLSLDFQFHNELIFLVDNPLLEEIWRPVGVRLRRYLYLNPRENYIPLSLSVQQHKDVCQAMRAGDLVKTKELIESHFCWTT